MTTHTQSSPAADVTEEAIQSFADRVRAALRDLPNSDVVELTEGLEASLAEQAADSSPGSALPHNGDAEAYADELREAAGLPAAGVVSENPAGKQPSRLDILAGRLSAMRDGIVESIRSKPALAGVLGFVLALQPVWWVVRGLLAFLLLNWSRQNILLGYTEVARLAPDSSLDWAALLVLTTMSVQLGRGKWMPWRWLAPVRLVGSTALLLWALTMISQLGHYSYYTYDQGYQDAMRWVNVGENNPVGATGLTVNGRPVENIFPYDAEGNPLSEVQLFDQAGKPIVPVSVPTETRYVNVEAADSGGPLTLVPRPIGSGMNAWNVFPLRRLPEGAMDYSTDSTGVFDITEAKPTALPKITVYPLAPLEVPAKADTKPSEATDPSKKPTP